MSGWVGLSEDLKGSVGEGLADPDQAPAAQGRGLSPCWSFFFEKFSEEGEISGLEEYRNIGIF